MENDFITTLNTNEKILFLNTILSLIKSDGKIDDKERELAHELSKIYNINEHLTKLPDKETLFKEIKTTIKDRKKAMLLLRELLITTHIDDDFEEKEMEFIEQVAQTLGIEDRLIIELNQLILDYKLLQIKSKKIMEG